MRPGQSCPGVVSEHIEAGLDSLRRFNEAGAIMPRSGLDPPVPGPGTCPGFNEAGAIMPRSGWL